MSKNAMKTIPDGYTTVTPWIISKDSAKLIEFLEKAFEAKEIEGSRMMDPEGDIGHVEVKIGTSIVMLFDSKDSWIETPGFFRLFLEDADKTYEKALQAGATSVTQITDTAWGDRMGRVRDPFGNIWWLQSHVTEVPYEEMMKRMKEPKWIEVMRYAQQSLAKALTRKK